MSKVIIILFFVFAIGAVVAVVAYLSYERPLEEQSIVFTNLTIAMHAQGSPQNLVTGYAVFLEGVQQPLAQGETLKDGRVLVQVPQNTTFIVYNFNLNKTTQKFYTNITTIRPSPGPQLVKLDVTLTPQGNLKVTHDHDPASSKANLYLHANGTIRGLTICTRWSRHVITVRTDTLVKVEAPSRLHNLVDACFTTNADLTNADILVPLYYDRFGAIDEYDYIKIYIVDGDLRYPSQQILIEEKDGSDLGIADFFHEIKLG